MKKTSVVKLTITHGYVKLRSIYRCKENSSDFLTSKFIVYHVRMEINYKKRVLLANLPWFIVLMACD